MAEPASRTRSAGMTTARGLSLSAIVAVALALGGCNTIEGMGKDLSAAGSAVSGTAQDAKEEM